MSNLSDLLPAGAGGKQVDFVATGTLASGVTVALKSDGTVEAISETSVPVSIPTTASPITYDATATYYNVSQFHPTNANIFVIAYGDAGSSFYGTAIVGTVSGNSITFSTPSVFESAGIFNTSIAFDASNPSNFVIAYTDQGNSNRGTAVIGTISGTSLSYGTPVAFTTGAAADIISVDFVSSNKFVVAYQDGGNSNYGTAIVGTVSGSSISYGSASVFESAGTYGCALKGDPNAADVFVVAYLDNGNSNYGNAIVGTVSGSSISYGSATVFKAAAIGSTENGISFDPNTANKFVIMFVSGGVFTAIIGTRSGTSLSFGSGAAIQNNSVTNPSISYNPNTANEFLIAYRNNGNSNYGTATVCTVSSSTITVGTSYIYNAYLSNYNTLAFDPSTSGKFAVSFYNAAASPTTVSSTILGQLAGTGTNNTSFIGITDAAISSAASGSVTIKGGISTIKGGTYAITVVNSGSGNKYAINGVEQAVLNLYEGATYKFDQSSGTNAGHPFRFSTTSDGTHGGGSEYTTGVTTSGVPGNAGAYTQIVLASGAATLYYYCTVHSGMGGTANTLAIVPNSNYYVQADGTLTTTSSTVLAGRALSSTSINLDYTT